MAKGRLAAAGTRHVHDWSYEPSLFFSEDEATVYVARFCIACGVREVADTTWRKPTKDELGLLLEEEARRDANPRADLDAAYECGFVECLNQARRALAALASSPAADAVAKGDEVL